MTHLCVCHDGIRWRVHPSLTHMMHSCVCHDSLTWRIHTCAMTHPRGGRGVSVAWLTRLIHVCAMTHAYVCHNHWRVACIRVPWLMDMTHLHVCHDSSPRRTRCISGVTYTTHLFVCHDSCICVLESLTCFIRTCAMTHWHVSFIRVPWLMDQEDAVYQWRVRGYLVLVYMSTGTFITATHCNTLQHTTIRCDTLQHTQCSFGLDVYRFATSNDKRDCNTLQHAATHCNTLNVVRHIKWQKRLQHTTTRCNTLQHIQCSSPHQMTKETDTYAMGWLQLVGSIKL